MKFTQPTFNHGDADCLGVLLTNLGTPDSCQIADVRRFLKEFLSDPRVVEVPRPIWWIILNCIILPTRPRKSAQAYQKIWGKDGSPLLTISQRIQQRLQESLLSNAEANAKSGSGALPSTSYKVELGMRYGNPSIATALAKLSAAGARKLLVLPLYPQYSATTTASTFDAIYAELARWRWLPEMRMINHYHDNSSYIHALTNSVQTYRKNHGNSEILLMSFHGIPQAYFNAGDPYHCECLKTARELAEQLRLSKDQWKISFQSRLGMRPWLQPYTDQTLIKLAQSGIRKVQVICPGFSADCLETLEEIAIENRNTFLGAGGAYYDYIPCLNDNDDHIRTLTKLVTKHTQHWFQPQTEEDRRMQKNRAMKLGAKR